jgi:polyisoprenoid-binding protein YceI
MKKQILNIVAIALVALSFTACKNDSKTIEIGMEEATEVSNDVKADMSGNLYTAKIVDSQIAWEGSKPVGTHSGTIMLNTGALYMSNGVLTGGKFSIDMTSINVTDLESGNGKESLEAHLMGTVEGKEGDFFDVAKYPNASFIIKSTKSNEGVTIVTGDLTIKDKTNSVSFPVSILEKDNVITLKSEQFEIDRTQWCINYGSKSIFDNLGDKFIDDAMKLKISIVAAK